MEMANFSIPSKSPSYNLPVELTNSQLYSEDLAPTPSYQRTWTIWNYAALWISMCHCLPTYALCGSLITGGMNWFQALVTIGIGNLIVLIPILLIIGEMEILGILLELKFLFILLCWDFVYIF